VINGIGISVYPRWKKIRKRVSLIIEGRSRKEMKPYPEVK